MPVDTGHVADREEWSVRAEPAGLTLPHCELRLGFLSGPVFTKAQ